MNIRRLCAQFDVDSVQNDVAGCAMRLAQDSSAAEVADLVFDLHFTLAVLTSHTGSTSDPEVAYLMATVVSVLTSIDRIIGMADLYELSADAVEELVRFSARTTVLLAAFSIDSEDESQ